MSLIKTQGIVLKHISISENDKIITILTDKLGKVDVVVHGAKSQKSKFMASSQPFCYGEYILYKGKSLYTLNESNINESFQVILMNLEKLTYGSYFLELVDTIAEKEIKNIPVLALLLKTLYIMTHSEVNLELLKLTVEFKAISLCGYMPQIKYCLKCRRILQEGYFSIRDGGIVCSECAEVTIYTYKVDFTDIQYFQTLKNIKLEDLNNFKYNSKKIEYIQNIMQNYIMYYTEKKFKSLEIINKIKQN